MTPIACHQYVFVAKHSEKVKEIVFVRKKKKKKKKKKKNRAEVLTGKKKFMHKQRAEKNSRELKVPSPLPPHFSNVRPSSCSTSFAL